MAVIRTGVMVIWSVIGLILEHNLVWGLDILLGISKLSVRDLGIVPPGLLAGKN